MSGYIDRDEFYNTESLLRSSIVDENKVASFILDQFLYDIKHFHAADVAPVRRGRWIEKPYLLGTSRFCSRCGENYGMPHAIYRYCPNCGARMDVEESETNEKSF